MCLAFTRAMLFLALCWLVTLCGLIVLGMVIRAPIATTELLGDVFALACLDGAALVVVNWIEDSVR